ncbi:hypothetical protein IT413_02365 [Candidatus Peregrinibacteria bacterium]|nr:hypothetical protein [Candidatus Peregrinibacteria bacterium]
MPENGEKHLDAREGLPEHLCFEDGLVEAVDRVQQLLATQDVVVVGLDGSDVNVGKSTLLTELSLRLDRLRIPVTTASFTEGIPDVASVLKLKQEVYNTNKSVFIIEHTGLGIFLTERALKMLKANRNAELEKAMQIIGIQKSQIDLFVSIYAPKRPFVRANDPSSYPLGDIVICNEKAVDKPRAPTR